LLAALAETAAPDKTKRIKRLKQDKYFSTLEFFSFK
jgi:hypothetical protein